MRKIIKEINGCCRVVTHTAECGPWAIFIELADGFCNSPRISYDCLIRAIGDSLIEAGVNINEPSNSWQKDGLFVGELDQNANYLEKLRP